MTNRRQRLRARRRAVGLSQEQLAQQLGVERSTVVRWESGETGGPQPWIRPKLAQVLNVSLEQLGHLLANGVRDAVAPPRSAMTGHLPEAQVEMLRQDLNEALTTGTVSEAGLDDWERSVIRYGRATRDRPPRLLLHDLSVDVIELRRLLHARQSASTLRRLTRVAAHLAGLMCLTFCKLDDRPAFRKWTRTARIAADEAGDPVVLAWVLAHAAYGHYYSGDLHEALDVAGHAREVTSTPSVGAALAAALEARAHAAFGHAAETRKRLTLAEDLLERLDGEALIPSAFGYTEAQFRFHEGNAYTHLRDTKSAMRAQEYALDLCAPGDYTDWAMTRLDRAVCLSYRGDVVDGLAYATETLNQLTTSQQQGIIALRGSQLLRTLPTAQRSLPAAKELQELLMLSTDRKEVEDR